MTDKNKKTDQNIYSNTLNLPQTNFSIRADFETSDKEILKLWNDINLYEKAFLHNSGAEKFILHDGPPYANGHIHLGHAYNKILKDVVTKFERMNGKHVPVLPGWDCHGLPIELAITNKFGKLSDVELKNKCRAFASEWIDIQKNEFKGLGVCMNWSEAFSTMDFAYESKILEALKLLFDYGYLENKNKTVPWCASCETVLANAEIENKERKDPSIYVKFELNKEAAFKLFPKVSATISCLVWTTTPWTLPLNKAVILRPKAIYKCVKIKNEYLICGAELVENFAKLVGEDFEVISTFDAEFLTGIKVKNPLLSNLEVPILFDEHVLLSDGTAILHCAPGCGPEDYEIALKNNLEIYSPLSADGRYTDEIILSELVGMKVLDGQIWVLKKLTELGNLFFKNNIKHSYPHCWRCGNGLIFRATKQWFCSLSKNDLREKALGSIDSIKIIPKSGDLRFKDCIGNRLEWCLSRQRRWGVPIPALKCSECEIIFLNNKLFELVIAGVAAEGIEFWDKIELNKFIKENKIICENKKCKSVEFSKEKDIVDVWFESGVSHFAVLFKNQKQQFPADIYLEGQDQFRAWFQSSLLTSLILEQNPPMRSIVAHGFTVDEKGKKMSKSQGNVVAPNEIIKKIGIDGLRLWVISNDVEGDPVYSDSLLKNVVEVYRKIRNTCRFLLSNLYDFNFEKDKIDIGELYLIDKYSILELKNLQERLIENYKMRKFSLVFHNMSDYFVQLSSCYLDVIKDRLYVEEKNGAKRRAAQTVCYYILDTITKLMAPVLSCLSEQLAANYKSSNYESILLQKFNNLNYIEEKLIFKSNNAVIKIFEFVFLLREAILKELEILRANNIIKHSLDASVKIVIVEGSKFYKTLQELLLLFNSNESAVEFFKDFFIVSKFELFVKNDSDSKEILEGVFLKIDKASGEKCARCWQYFEDINNKELCLRCKNILKL